MTEEKNHKNSQIHSSSDVQSKKNKKKYIHKNSSYYYYMKKKKKKNNSLDETTNISIIDDKKDDVTVKKVSSVSFDEITAIDLPKIKEQLNKQDDDLIITKEFNFNFDNTDNNKEMLEDLKQAIDMYYYEEEMNKFSIKEDNKHLKELPEYIEDDKKNEIKKDKKVKKNEKIKEKLEDIDTIIPFKTEPIPKKLRDRFGKKKISNEIFDDAIFSNEEKNDDLIITREIDFNYDAKDLKKKKVLNELKDAIDDFDRVEMLSEIEASVDVISTPVDKKEVINNKKEEKRLAKKERLEKKKEEKIKKKEQKDSSKKEIVVNKLVVNEEVKELDNSDVDKDKQLETYVQPMVEEDRFTQILNKIDLEEKLKELANSEESSNYLAQDFLNLKNKDIQKIQYDTSSKKNLYLILGTILGFVIIVVLLVDYFKNRNDVGFISSSYTSNETVSISRDDKFLNCMKRNYQNSDRSNELIAKEQEVTEYIKNKYDASFIYQDVQTGYSFGYNSAETYYAASTIKLLDALYVYSKAAIGAIDLDATITYTEKYATESSLGLDNYNYGDEISIRDLVKYAVSVSDNSAHLMLVSYIGKNKIKDFGNELGATYTMVGSDTFGDINCLDAIVYLKALNDFINTNPIYANELKELFINSDDNYLNIGDEIVAIHKYGHYERNYHSIGIVCDKNPYMIAILTHEGFNKDIEGMIRDINKKIYELHNLYYELRDTTCYAESYMD